MENFKFVFFTILIILLVGGFGYWSFSTVETGSEHVKKQKIKLLSEENNYLKEENKNLQNKYENLDNNLIEDSNAKEEIKEINMKENISDNKINEELPSYKYQTLINEIQKLINNKITIKKGSKGAQVGTIQKFLNIYNNTSNKIDNDYGAKTETIVKDFQKKQEINSNGEIKSDTLIKMIELLKKE